MFPRFAEPVALDQAVRPRRSWRDPRTRAILWQAVVVAAACAVVAMVAMQTAANLRARDVASGFDYLSRAAGFEIAQGGLSYSSRDTYARALEVGLVNTLRVAGIGIAVASALGLSRLRTLRLVVLPQALPVIVPPTTSQFLNLAKNSSLAVAIGYPDVISITNTTLNQTGQAVEAIAIAMILYLAISLAISFPMNLWPGAVARTGGRKRVGC